MLRSFLCWCCAVKENLWRGSTRKNHIQNCELCGVHICSTVMVITSGVVHFRDSLWIVKTQYNIHCSSEKCRIIFHYFFVCRWNQKTDTYNEVILRWLYNYINKYCININSYYCDPRNVFLSVFFCAKTFWGLIIKLRTNERGKFTHLVFTFLSKQSIPLNRFASEKTNVCRGCIIEHPPSVSIWPAALAYQCRGHFIKHSTLLIRSSFNPLSPEPWFQVKLDILIL